MLRQRVKSRPVVVVTGARQTGKTTLVKRLFPRYSYVSLDLPSEAAQAETEPRAFLARHPAPVIVDEIQYAPGLLRFLKLDVDAHREENGRYILTGSQPFELMAGVSESLAGRASVLTLGGLTYGEIRGARPDFRVEDFVLRGGYPELYEKPDLDARDYFQSYVATYLERDLRNQLRVGSLRDFERFLRVAALRTAQLVNRADMARDVGISGSTAGEWLSLLERSGVLRLLEPWFSRRTKALIKTPKLHLMDCGLAAHLVGMFSPGDLFESPLSGALWESAVHQEIAGTLAVTGNWQLAFWRDRTKEADFLFHRAGRFLLADAKWSEAPRDPGKLARVLEEMPAKTRGALICRTANAFGMGHRIEALPLGDLAGWIE